MHLGKKYYLDKTNEKLYSPVIEHNNGIINRIIIEYLLHVALISSRS